MPKLTKEITSGSSFQFSSNQGEVSAQQNRVFKIVLNSPGELFDIQSECDVYIGDAHPYNSALYCTAYDAQFDGNSRMVVICTFTYQASAGVGSQNSDPKQSPPDVRPANWSISTSLVEVPVNEWKRIGGPQTNDDDGWVIPKNPAQDLYEGITKLEPLVTITIEQFELVDPTRHCMYAGAVNSEQVTLGTLQCPARSVMFRGVQCRPHVETYGESGVARGWLATYEFAYRQNYVPSIGESIGWDRAEPQVGFNVINKESALGGGDNERGALALAHSNGRIADWPDDPSLAEGTEDQKVRAMVLVFEYEDGGASQRPSALPVALNDDGTPRSRTATPPVHVYRYQVYPDINFSMFNIRLT